ncbi:MAG TPA: hypothetical protein PK400_04005 [Phycisphaerales bacterium]|nr:hypothetical protein [Phycisphaerales bacterium]HRQ76121.1 hypothetical protein [Phycisphaerales bacterium]
MNVPVSMRRLWVQLTADRKRFGILCAALAVGLLLWGRVIIVTNVPRTAVAKPDQKVASTTAKPSTTSAKAKSEPKTSDKPRRVLRVLPTIAIDLDKQPQRDPFMISSQHFPQTPASGDRGSTRVDVIEDAETVEARLIAGLQQMASKLKLEAIMGGVGGGMVLINARAYRLGQLIPVPGHADVSFELVEVRDRSVVIENQGRRFVLSMPTPGSRE